MYNDDWEEDFQEAYELIPPTIFLSVFFILALLFF